eukprot:1138948-Pelagomonas_calceolata.AAC.3
MKALLTAERGAVERAAVGEEGGGWQGQAGVWHGVNSQPCMYAYSNENELHVNWTAHDPRSLETMHIMLLQIRKGKGLCGLMRKLDEPISALLSATAIFNA